MPHSITTLYVHVPFQAWVPLSESFMKEDNWNQFWFFSFYNNNNNNNKLATDISISWSQISTSLQLGSFFCVYNIEFILLPHRFIMLLDLSRLCVCSWANNFLVLFHKELKAKGCHNIQWLLCIISQNRHNTYGGKLNLCVQNNLTVCRQQ